MGIEIVLYDPLSVGVHHTQIGLGKSIMHFLWRVCHFRKLSTHQVWPNRSFIMGQLLSPHFQRTQAEPYNFPIPVNNMCVWKTLYLNGDSGNCHLIGQIWGKNWSEVGKVRREMGWFGLL